jgi:hypothetical protein
VPGIDNETMQRNKQSVSVNIDNYPFFDNLNDPDRTVQQPGQPGLTYAIVRDNIAIIIHTMEERHANNPDDP